MLSLKNIGKTYLIENKKNKVLENININFRKNEFVIILGPSGSGKSTLLNIIGGIIKNDTGNMLINQTNVNKFTQEKWDYYRNKKIGFIFQNYNLISHISILSNVLMPALIENANKKTQAIEILKKLGIKDISKKPKELSGGEQQRVAIARSLINDPDIILSDEPTGALDTKNSIQIMEYMKKISNKKLVIMVTHNEYLARKYATRIIKMEDGKIISDSNPYTAQNKLSQEKFPKLKEKIKASFKLAVSNLLTKKGRALITSLGIAIGIIGISLVLALSTGFKQEINKFEKNTLVSLPIVIGNDTYNLDSNNKSTYPKKEQITKETENINHTNKITEEYLSYIEKSNNILGISYKYNFIINLINKNAEGYINTNNNDVSMGVIPNNKVIENQYDILKGRFPNNKNELLLVVDGNNKVNESILKALGINKENVSFDEILNTKIKLILNNDYYKKEGNFFVSNKDLELLYKTKGETLSIVGIIRMKKAFPTYMQTSGLLYTKELSNHIIKTNTASDIVKIQKDTNINLLTGNVITEEEKKELLTYLGNESLPNTINIYLKDFKEKEKLISYLDKYNKNKPLEEKIMYTDQAKLIVTLSDNILSSITIILLAFSIISLIVSTIMIGIIIYISVLERKKEIGILRSLGMSRKGIKRLFKYESLIIGIISFIMGIIISRLLIIPVNIILKNITEINNIASLNLIDILILFLVNILVSQIGAQIPAKKASKCEIASSIRAE